MTSPPTPRPGDALLSPVFLLSLLVLGVNDHLLKAAFPGWLTGKLSDFAGVFAFAVALGVALGGRRVAGAVLAGALFAWWKTPLAQPALDAWNALPLFDVARVVDATDLFALLVLVPAARMRLAPLRLRARAWKPAVALASVLLFAATSRLAPAIPGPLRPEWTASQTPEEITEILYAWEGTQASVRVGPEPWTMNGKRLVWLSMDVGGCNYGGYLDLSRRREGGTTMSIRRLGESCPTRTFKAVEPERLAVLIRRVHDNLLRPALGESVRWVSTPPLSP